MKPLIFVLFLSLVVLAPLPLGSNREWAWSACAVVTAVLALGWSMFDGAQHRLPEARVWWWAVPAFLIIVTWIALQQVSWVPEAWKHPLWSMTATALDQPVPGYVSVSPQESATALMRLLTYALVFVIAFQAGRDRSRARATFACLTIAGLAYALFGLLTYWGDYHPAWLFGERALPRDVRATFVNRNHFATWQGLILLVAMAYFHLKLSRPSLKPYSMPQDREAQVEAFLLAAWKPLAALLLMSAALVLTHSRGGFAATLAGSLVLLYLLDRRDRRGRAASRAVVIAALAVASLAFYLTSEVLLDRINRTDITSEERMAVFADVNRGISDNPALGYGYGTFADSFRMYNQVGTAVHYDRAHNTWLENAFELGLPAALLLYSALTALAVTCLRGVFRRRRDWVFPATGVAASVTVGVHAMVDFSLQLPAVAMAYACVMGIACAQSYSCSGRGHPADVRPETGPHNVYTGPGP